MGLAKKIIVLLFCFLSLSFIALIIPSKILAAQCGRNTVNPTCWVNSDTSGVPKNEGDSCSNNALDGGPGICQITGTGNFCSCQPPTGPSNPTPTTPPSSSPSPGTGTGSTGGRTTPAADDPDINIRRRVNPSIPNDLFYVPASFPGGLLDHPENTDTKQPRLSTIFDPNFSGFFQIKNRGGTDRDTSNITNPGMATIRVNAGATIRAPFTGYQIGGGYNYVVLYVNDAGTDIVIHNTLSDSVADGYTIHFLDISVDPLIKHLYDQNEANGRKQLVAISCETIIGNAPKDPYVSIRDSGSFMDIRFKDWWGTQFVGSCQDVPPGLITPAAPAAPSEPSSYIPKDVPCDQVTDPEFHSLRPYPASPCYKKVEETALTCGNDLIVKKTFHVTPSEAQSCVGNVCKFSYSGLQNSITIDLKGAQLPIMGNTELVPNQTWTSPDTNATNLTAAQRMNNYVSWYLNGVVDRAEEDFSSHNTNYLVNFSGPLNKLLPLAVETAVRLTSVNNANGTISKPTEARHNQTVGCLFPSDLGGTGSMPCYLFSQNYLISLLNSIDPKISTKIEFIQTWLAVIKSENRLIDWLSSLLGIPNKPPVESDYANFSDYWKAYLTWRGKVCTPDLFGTKFYLCANLGRENLWALLFKFIPSSSTEDRVGQVLTDTNNAQGKLANTIQLKDGAGNGGTVTNVSFTPVSDNHNLYFSHMQEDAELAKLLQGTFATKADTNDWEGQLQGAIANQSIAPLFNTYGCVKQEIRTNSGDNLYGDINRVKADGSTDQQITGTLKYDVSFTCEFKPQTDNACVELCNQLPTQSGKEACLAACTKVNVCDKDIYTSLGIYTKTPKAYEVWQRLVDGSMGVFKRFFPLVGVNSPLYEIKDIPAVTQAVYRSDGNQTQAGTTGVLGSEAELYFPHIGSLQEYFLKGIQKALRPKGFDNTVLAGAPSSTTSGLELQCSLGGNVTVHRVLNAPDAFISDKTIALALRVAKATCTPTEILIGIMAKESRGLANGDTPYMGDPNEIGNRNCAATNNNCGAYSFADIDIAAAYQHRADQMNSCLVAIGLQPGERDQKKLGVSLCAAGTEFWSGSVCVAKNACDGREHSLTSLTSGQIKNAALEFHAKDCDPSQQGQNKDSDGAWAYYDQFIRIYAPDVQRIRAACGI